MYDALYVQNSVSTWRILKTAPCLVECLITPSRHTLLRSLNWYQSFGLHCFGLHTIGGRWMCLRLGVLAIECPFLMECPITRGGLKCLLSLRCTICANMLRPPM